MDWIETSSGNRISKNANIYGSDHILISGNTTISPQVTLVGDVNLEGKSSLQIGKFCFIDTGVLIQPTLTKKSEPKIYKPCKIGSYVMIGNNTKIQASNIGSRVQIGANCEIGNNSIIHDCVIISDGSIVQENQIIPPFSLVQGSKVEVLPESFKKVLEIDAKKSYVNNQLIPSCIPYP